MFLRLFEIFNRILGPVCLALIAGSKDGVANR
jgi:hypothetical protein